MKLSKRRTIVLVVFVAAILSTIIAVPLLTPKPDLETVVQKAVDFFENSNDPYALLWLDVMYRRFGVTEFSGALERYDQLLAENPDNAALLRIFRRMSDYYNTYQSEDLEAVYADVDRLIIPALYCNTQALREDYPEMLNKAVVIGDYQLTHALLALIFIQENNYQLSLPDGFVENVYSSNAQMINDDQTVTDKELEAAAFLYLARQEAHVNNSFIEKVLTAQKNDGGWTITGNKADDSNWHPTILALLLLLHVQYPSDSYPPTLAPAPN